MSGHQHDHGHSHGHSHGPSVARASARHLRPLIIAFWLTVGFLVVQVVVGLVTGSLALLSDAGHMATDALGLGMAWAAIVWGVTDWHWVDPVVGAAIGLFILPRALRLGRDALRVLVQSAPHHIDIAAVQSDLAAIDGVLDVHDLHVWTLTSEMDVATAHLVVSDGTDTHGVLDRANTVLIERHGIDHSTLQVEPADHRGCETVDW